MVYGAARVCKGINLRGREAYATVPNTSTARTRTPFEYTIKDQPVCKCEALLGPCPMHIVTIAEDGNGRYRSPTRRTKGTRPQEVHDFFTP